MVKIAFAGKGGNAGKVSENSDVKWAIKVGKYQENLEDKKGTQITGEKIALGIEEKWSGKEIAVMPYLNEATEKVAVKTIVFKQLLTITINKGVKLFTLNGEAYNLSGQLTVKKIYDEYGLQWFEPSADKYIPLVSIEHDITSRNELKHFSWNDIVEFAEKNRGMFAYRREGPGDWKYVKEGGDRYILVSVGGVPYWADAIGQIPFAINCFIHYLKFRKDYSFAREKTIEEAKRRSRGQVYGGERDDTNSYDNAMVLRAINWATKRFKFKDGKLLKTSHSPKELSKASNGEEIG